MHESEQFLFKLLKRGYLVIANQTILQRVRNCDLYHNRLVFFDEVLYHKEPVFVVFCFLPYLLVLRLHAFDRFGEPIDFLRLNSSLFNLTHKLNVPFF